ncbi:hypothetical protein [uncultured Aquimarina sp.]|uniref:hypothetical protein n=1 Tax=uncultured Aquimarina sp. TaxID=575652 RepID=UPI002633B0E9|nr:hypothetical protein [uncultured Aquimarina sp.]
MAVMTVSEVDILAGTGMSRASGVFELGVRVRSTYPPVTYARGEKKASDGRTLILGECID